jgi:threonyl-tRNA synthetase
MAPTQVRIIPVNSEVSAYARSLEDLLRASLMRVETDLSDNSFNKKIREAVTKKIPNMVIIGNKEMEERTITLRRYCTKAQVTMPLEGFVERMKRCLAERLMDNFEDVEV